MKVKRIFVTQGSSPYKTTEWEKRTAEIKSDKGEVLFRQKDVKVPKSWSDNALNVVASKYFKENSKSPQREKGVDQLIDRVVDTITKWGIRDKVFTKIEGDAFSDELKYVLVNQMGAFNSPVWFNVGISSPPQASACFIQSLEDTMESILGLTVKEGMLFKHGSGTGTNYSNLRSAKEHISGGGIASGPVSFMKGWDAFAGIIKSGGKSRRAAKMAILEATHPDILDFIESKVKEEKKAWALIDAGYDGSLNGEAYNTVAFQNQNNSVRVDDKFMNAVIKDDFYWTKYVKSGEPAEKYKAKDVLKKIAEAAHFCGCPGIQFHDTVNEWHTCPNSGVIRASNPCGEFIFLDDSACNLASINLLKFLKDDGTFDIEGFMHVASLFIIAQELLCGNASYPSKEITDNSLKFRPLGLGYANLGALLMLKGLSYDSNEGRTLAAAITSLMTAKAYMTSVELAKILKPFSEYNKNAVPMQKIVKKHKEVANQYLEKLKADRDQSNTFEIMSTAVVTFEAVIAEGAKHGFRNAQVTLLAPTGTIGFMMDCDSTGVEPCVALIAYKKTSDGSLIVIANKIVEKTLAKLGYEKKQIDEICAFISKEGFLKGAPHIQEKHLPVFYCSIAADELTVPYMGHIKMMSAIQPFLSGAISKTVNMPEKCTPDEITEVYTEAWKLGLKSVTIYRQDSKRVQPINLKRESTEITEGGGRQYRKKLPDLRPSLTHKFTIAGHEGYIIVGLYPDTNKPGEVFIKMAKEGSTISGLMDTIATQTSIMLQSGIPLETLVEKFSHMDFEPRGLTNNPDIKFGKSPIDYVFRWLGKMFLNKEVEAPKTMSNSPSVEEKKQQLQFGPPCPTCGNMTVRTGACYSCKCGYNGGCG